ncbi:hypothetical protein PR048_020260 [Dryococelus australis]|uniref:Uncharacterized protein n=1 Tax=Dryococelus australis TaxID=614101 RepID=A0ABQ9H5T9_9NEOP|nr:hypothetical protein PR048_020260 [Dryococelus australis]
MDRPRPLFSALFGRAEPGDPRRLLLYSSLILHVPACRWEAGKDFGVPLRPVVELAWAGGSTRHDNPSKPSPRDLPSYDHGDVSALLEELARPTLVRSCQAKQRKKYHALSEFEPITDLRGNDYLCDLLWSEIEALPNESYITDPKYIIVVHTRLQDTAETDLISLDTLAALFSKYLITQISSINLQGMIHRFGRCADQAALILVSGYSSFSKSQLNFFMPTVHPRCSCTSKHCRGHDDICSHEPWWLSGLPVRLPPRRTGFNPWPYHSRVFESRDRAGRCRWSAGFLGDLSFSLPFNSDATPNSCQSPSSALKTSLLRAAQIYPLTSLNPGSRSQKSTEISSSLGQSKHLTSMYELFGVLAFPYNSTKLRRFPLTTRATPCANPGCFLIEVSRNRRGTPWKYNGINPVFAFKRKTQLELCKSRPSGGIRRLRGFLELPTAVEVDKLGTEQRRRVIRRLPVLRQPKLSPFLYLRAGSIDRNRMREIGISMQNCR